MRIAAFIRKTWLSTSCLFIPLALSPFISHAAAPATISEYIQQHSAVFDHAVVIIAPRREVMAFRRPMGAIDLPSIGCTYNIGRDGLAPLLDLLVADGLADDATTTHAVNARIGIDLYLQNGEKTSLILEDPFPDTGAHGAFNGSRRFIAKHDFNQSLRALFAQPVPNRSNGPCELNRSSP